MSGEGAPTLEGLARPHVGQKLALAGIALRHDGQVRDPLLIKLYLL